MSLTIQLLGKRKKGRDFTTYRASSLEWMGGRHVPKTCLLSWLVPVLPPKPLESVATPPTIGPTTSSSTSSSHRVDSGDSKLAHSVKSATKRYQETSDQGRNLLSTVLGQAKRRPSAPDRNHARSVHVGPQLQAKWAPEDSGALSRRSGRPSCGGPPGPEPTRVLHYRMDHRTILCEPCLS